MDYFLGVDIGGSKSHALIADAEGQALGFGHGGAGNYEVVGWDGLERTLHVITAQALESANISMAQISGAGFGIAGYDWPGEWERTRQAVDSLGVEAPYKIVNDAIVGLVAGASEGWGVVIVAGTSNNCRGRDRHGREGRVTGCGPVYGEYGGAGELVAEAIRAVAKAWTARGPATALTQALVKLAGASGETDLLEGLYLERYQLSAEAARLIFQVAAQGDPVAQATIQWAGRELGSLAVGVIHQLGFQETSFEVVLAGSLYDGGPLLIETLQETIHTVAPGARLVRLKAPPVVGGVLLGIEQIGVRSEKVRQHLIRSTGEMMTQVGSSPGQGYPFGLA